MANSVEKIVVGDRVLIRKDVASVDSDNPVAFHKNHEGVVRRVYSSGYVDVDVAGVQILRYDPADLFKVNKRG